MRRTLHAGGVKVVSAPQLFPAPMLLAERMVALAAPRLGERVLEPSAGSGNLLRALPGVIQERAPIGTLRQTVCDVVAVELNLALRDSLIHEGLAQRVIGGDFLACTPEDLGLFDVILMNPPFADGADIAHIRHAREFLAVGGRLVALCADGPRQREQLLALGEYEPLPEGSFASVGTQVRAALLVIRT
ncbi:methyltransferase [Xenophilus azovorans]|uniref:methyltransferase n=1 Tax=Xenophilus azovorans TaxID=151755 RepID=UPI0005711EF4|nr:methyltransferase [Xenophilus azovorans]